MSATVQLSVSGAAVPAEFYDAIRQLEVEESADEPGALIEVRRQREGDRVDGADGQAPLHDAGMAGAAERHQAERG